MESSNLSVNTIRLWSGRLFDLANPKPDQFCLEDIANALAKICRFNGHVKKFYSVAEHSIHCLDHAIFSGLSVEAQIACLFHDATEAFVGDMVKPLKIMIPQYSEIETRIEKVIEEKFNIDFTKTRRLVHDIDCSLLEAERSFLFDQKTSLFERLIVQPTVFKPDFKCFLPGEATTEFLDRAVNLLLSVGGETLNGN